MQGRWCKGGIEALVNLENLEYLEMREKIKKYKEILAPYWDVILFLVCMFAANFFWKLTIDADEHGGPVHWFGMDISAPFDFLASNIAQTIHWLVSLTRDTLIYIPPNRLVFTSTGHGETIIWGCTAIKQSFIWMIIILFARGKWYHKLWFIPLGWVCCHLFNIFRLYIITLVIEYHNDMFSLMHDYLFKYLFYFMLFMLWVWWTEKIAGKKME